MKQSAYSRARDERIADEVASDPNRCPAHGCPMQWSVSGERGRACSAHYFAEREDWPRVTEQLLRDEGDRAMLRGQRSIPAALSMTREQRLAVLAKLRDGIGSTDKRAWARQLRERHLAGERLTHAQVAAYEAALGQDERRAAAMTAQPFDLPPVAPPMPPAVELPPVDAYAHEADA
ncbi:MAG TPA: hypothetical protein VN680_00175 [Burkholderiaceae bacterium]|nr:hypothetical protein [Burkholderiaceae bacterium]